MRIVIARIVIMLMAVTAAIGNPGRRERDCRGNPKVIAGCFSIHGRAFASNGTPDLRIWRIGTRRILGVTATSMPDDAEEPIAPENLLRALGGTEHFVFGDFEVCPFTAEREGEMQMVCVQKANHLVLKPYGWSGKR